MHRLIGWIQLRYWKTPGDPGWIEYWTRWEADNRTSAATPEPHPQTEKKINHKINTSLLFLNLLMVPLKIWLLIDSFTCERLSYVKGLSKMRFLPWVKIYDLVSSFTHHPGLVNDLWMPPKEVFFQKFWFMTKLLAKLIETLTFMVIWSKYIHVHFVCIFIK